MTKKKKYYKIVGIAIAVVVLSIGLYWFVQIRNNQTWITFQDTNIIEYGDKTVTSKSLVKENHGNDISYPKLDVMKAGKQKLLYTAKKASSTKEFTFEVEIKDTKKPIIKVKQNRVHILEGDRYSLYDNIESVRDPVDGVLPYANKQSIGSYTVTSDFDASTTGEYSVKIVASDMYGNVARANFTIQVEKKQESANEADTEVVDTDVDSAQPTYVNGVLLVNKHHAVRPEFGGVDDTASAALAQLQTGANAAGHAMPLISGYRSYDYQATLYNNYVAVDGQAMADRYSARPGTSEHQTGLAFDIGQLDTNFANTPAGTWLKEHAHEYGFIIRYPQDKESITGYMYEPWHVRYLGVDLATSVFNSGLTLEEYLGV